MRPFPLIPVLLASLWLPSGFLWMANAEHFGWGFLPMLIWFFSFPLLTLTFITLAIIEACRAHRSVKHGIAWTILAAAYGIPMVVWAVMHPHKFGS